MQEIYTQDKMCVFGVVVGGRTSILKFDWELSLCNHSER